MHFSGLFAVACKTGKGVKISSVKVYEFVYEVRFFVEFMPAVTVNQHEMRRSRKFFFDFVYGIFGDCPVISKF